jgi:8-hydroxy-5-deazaflavin:NADPH oxidoreductase
MNIAIFGTGMVGQTISSRLQEIGHNVTLGTRDVGKSKSRQEKDRTGTSFSEWYESKKISSGWRATPMLQQNRK